MKNRIVRNTIKAVAFTLIGVLLFMLFVRLFHFKFSKEDEAFFQLPKNSVDVLMVGSSHAWHNFNPDVLYKESGISAFVIGSPSQTIWNSYYYIKEALKVQKPKVVFLECYKVYDHHKYSDEPTAVKSAANMPFSLDYIENIRVSLKDKSKVLETVLMFPWYHTRYTELSGEDYKPYYGDIYYKDFLGFDPVVKPVDAYMIQGLEHITERRPMSKKTVKYLDKTVELCKEKGVDLVFILTPAYRGVDRYQKSFNALADYAEEKGIPLINGNLLYDELGLDVTTDFSYGNHLTVSGANKISYYVNDFLNLHYDLPDHRGDPYYSRWENHRLYMQEYYGAYY